MGKKGSEETSDVICMQPCGLRLWQVSVPFAEHGDWQCFLALHIRDDTR